MVTCGIFSANQTPTPRQGTPKTVAKQPKSPVLSLFGSPILAHWSDAIKTIFGGAILATHYSYTSS